MSLISGWIDKREIDTTLFWSDTEEGGWDWIPAAFLTVSNCRKKDLMHLLQKSADSVGVKWLVDII